MAERLAHEEALRLEEEREIALGLEAMERARLQELDAEILRQEEERLAAQQGHSLLPLHPDEIRM